MSYQLASGDRSSSQGESAPPNRDFAFENVVGDSETILEAVDMARKVAGQKLTTVLLVGETGTGKELFARGIHYSGPRPGEAFVAVNCAAIPESLLESELFGHERGAFTDARSEKRGLFELAGRGTLFLDEISELPPNLQPKLLRVLEERSVRRVGGVQEMEIRCRVIAGTNETLEDAVAGGKFREDLFYRLNVFRVTLPPLRERDSDVELLARHFVREATEELGLEPKKLSPEALATLRNHPWPGNVRELKNVIQRAVILSESEWVGPEHMRIQDRRTLPADRKSTAPVGEIVIPPGGKSLELIEAEAIRLTLQLTEGNQSAAARILGISRPTLARKLRLNGIDPRHYRPSGSRGRK